MMISAQQIRAARAMLEWSQETLAQESGLSLATIYNLEKGHQSIRSSMGLRKAFESKGVEFSGTNTVSRRLEEHINYGGPEGTEKFYQDLLSTARDDDGDIVAMFASQEDFAKVLGVDPKGSLSRLDELSRYARIKCLLWDVRKSGLFIPYFEFRAATTKRKLSPFSLVAYGRKTALIAFDNSFTYFVMTSTAITTDAVKDFMIDWDAALPIIGMSPAK